MENPNKNNRLVLPENGPLPPPPEPPTLPEFKPDLPEDVSRWARRSAYGAPNNEINIPENLTIEGTQRILKRNELTKADVVALNHRRQANKLPPVSIEQANPRRSPDEITDYELDNPPFFPIVDQNRGMRVHEGTVPLSKDVADTVMGDVEVFIKGMYKLQEVLIQRRFYPSNLAIEKAFYGKEFKKENPGLIDWADELGEREGERAVNPPEGIFADEIVELNRMITDLANYKIAEKGYSPKGRLANEFLAEIKQGLDEYERQTGKRFIQMEIVEVNPLPPGRKKRSAKDGPPFYRVEIRNFEGVEFFKIIRKNISEAKMEQTVADLKAAAETARKVVVTIGKPIEWTIRLGMAGVRYYQDREQRNQDRLIRNAVNRGRRQGRNQVQNGNNPNFWIDQTGYDPYIDPYIDPNDTQRIQYEPPKKRRKPTKSAAKKTRGAKKTGNPTRW
jgi:hypothetical protein